MNLMHLRTALRQAWLTYEYDFNVESEDYGWSEDDAKHLLEFFENTEAGRKLKKRLTNYVLRAATYALKQPDVVRHAGIAEGIQLGIQAIEEHFYVSPIRNSDNPMTEKEEKSEPRRLSQLR